MGKDFMGTNDPKFTTYDDKPSPRLFGKMQARNGGRCTNPGRDDLFTTPCCYADVSEGATVCPECGTSITCTIEKQPVAVCTITAD